MTDKLWDGEGLVPVGTICELVIPAGYSLDDKHWETGDEIEILAHRPVNHMMLPIVYNKSIGGANSLVPECIRPTQSERDRVIKAVTIALGELKTPAMTDYRASILGDAFDAGFLKMPEDK